MKLFEILAFIINPEGSFLDPNRFLDLGIRFLFNLIIAFTIIRYIYYPQTRRKDYLFSFFLISTVVFFLAYLMSDVELKLGFAFGLFALFGILRYRTSPIPIKEMTYLFILIGIAVINSISGNNIPYFEILFTNLVILIMLFALEKLFLLSHESSIIIRYENIDLVREDRKDEIIADLRKRTGLNIHRVEILDLNYIRDSANLKVFFYEKNNIQNAENSFDNENEN